MAPATQSSSTRPNGTGANAQSFALITCASARGVVRGSAPSRGHKRMAMPVQRTREGQPVAASPRIENAPNMDLVAAADTLPCDQWASAAAITPNVYTQRRATSAGTTSTTASHALHRYLRAAISVSLERPAT